MHTTVCTTFFSSWCKQTQLLIHQVPTCVTKELSPRALCNISCTYAATSTSLTCSCTFPLTLAAEFLKAHIDNWHYWLKSFWMYVSKDDYQSYFFSSLFCQGAEEPKLKWEHITTLVSSLREFVRSTDRKIIATTLSKLKLELDFDSHGISQVQLVLFGFQDAVSCHFY